MTFEREPTQSREIYVSCFSYAVCYTVNLPPVPSNTLVFLISKKKKEKNALWLAKKRKNRDMISTCFIFPGCLSSSVCIPQSLG